MVQTATNKPNSRQRYDHSTKVLSITQPAQVVYDRPKVVVVRRYTRTIVRDVNPDEYQTRFNKVLLDTSTLLELARRLNIQEYMVNIRIIRII